MTTRENCRRSAIILGAPIWVVVRLQRIIRARTNDRSQPGHDNSSIQSYRMCYRLLDAISCECLSRKPRNDMYAIENIPPDIPGFVSSRSSKLIDILRYGGDDVTSFY